MRDKKEMNLNMLVSGFVDGKLIYILEFPFNFPDFIRKLKTKVKKWKDKLEGSKTAKGQFLRSADFDYRDYINCPNLKVVYLLPKSDLEKYQQYISRDFYKFLWNKAK